MRREPVRVVIGPSWDDPDADLLAFDRLVHAAESEGPVELVLEIARPEEARLRWQRLSPVRNAAAASTRFEVALARHRQLHDIGQPLVRADLDHAHDAWQWVVRLAPDASAEAQLAALMHDVERLESEATTRVEHLAADYRAFKAAHAARGAEIVRGLLGDLFPAVFVERVADLVARHEVPGDDPELALLNDADALSFFALNSAGYLAWFGPEQTTRKVDYTLGRMSARARPWLSRIRLPRAIRAQVDAELDLVGA